ncbi:MAG: hypothetical protein IJW55_08565 [Clostridia bacterium]|nr:hypothetical protein [Clostridia bacterium]
MFARTSTTMVICGRVSYQGVLCTNIYHDGSLRRVYLSGSVRQYTEDSNEPIPPHNAP